MSLFRLALLGLLASPALAQEAPLPAADFQAKMQEAANAAGTARLPVACGGLFRALQLIAEEGSETKAGFAKQEEDMAFFATVSRQKETGEEQGPAIDFVAEHIRNVSALYLARMSRNKSSGAALIDDLTRETYDYCVGVNDRLNAALKK